VLDRATWWTVDHHFQQDVPAVLKYVLAATGAKQVHWIGHSMVSMSRHRQLGGSLFVCGCVGVRVRVRVRACVRVCVCC
jgi:hypothetical protein